MRRAKTFARNGTRTGLIPQRSFKSTTSYHVAKFCNLCCNLESHEWNPDSLRGSCLNKLTKSSKARGMIAQICLFCFPQIQVSLQLSFVAYILKFGLWQIAITKDSSETRFYLDACYYRDALLSSPHAYVGIHRWGNSSVRYLVSHRSWRYFMAICSNRLGPRWNERAI